MQVIFRKIHAKVLLFFVTAVLFTQACGGTATSTMPKSIPPGTPDSIELVYFYKSNPPPCECLANAGINVQAVVKEDFAAELDSGKLVFHYIASDQKKNAEIIKKYDPSPFCLGMTIVHGSVSNIVYIEEIWEYLYNESKFKEVLKTAIRKALDGEWK